MLSQLGAIQNGSSLFDQGNQFKELGQFSEAIQAYRQAAQLTPNFAWVHHNLGE
ncbi:tetratricopeptide repeat protein, partial [Planktothrix sp.]|uniref:tetratricopeptide repeat protein n=1 Tax=Planktothrix sp. TaxID=3088171 RepID=UPI0038D4445A